MLISMLNCMNLFILFVSKNITFLVFITPQVLCNHNITGKFDAYDEILSVEI